MSLNEIASSLRLIEKAKYQYSLGDQTKAKKTVLEAVNILNVVLKSDPADIALVKSLCFEAIELHKGITSKERLLSFDERLSWLGSVVNGGFYPPLNEQFQYVETVDLDDKLHLSIEQQKKLIGWESIGDHADWTLQGTDHWFQDYLQDCSFVASIISLSKNNAQELLDTIIPRFSSRRHGVKLHFNGCKRLVEVGDKLPKLNGECLYIKSWSNENLLWAALIEKAYLKVQGHGYEAKGSNASIDTYMVSGWIPDFINANQRVNLRDAWESLYTHFQQNELVLSLGTGEFTEEFHPNHDYSVLELVEETGSVVLKNPWERTITSIKFTEIFEHFETLYINWNPINFLHSKMNFVWTFGENILYNYPQFSVKNDSTKLNEIWILVEKHLGYQESSINTFVYQSQGEKLISKGKSLAFNSANNSGFHLSKFKLEAGQCATIVVSNDARQTQNFTIHSYSTYEASITKAKVLLPFAKTIEGEWTVESCGGNWSHQSYIKNPQYELHIPQQPNDVNITFGLYSKEDVLLNFQLYWIDDKPFTQKKSLINEKYQPGSVVSSISLKSGIKYKIVVSTYDPDILASFKLIVNSDSDFQINKISTSLGLFTKSFKFEWNNKNRFKLRFSTKWKTTANFHIWTDNLYSSYRPKIRASLFYADGRPIDINTEFNDSLFGIWLQNEVLMGDESVILLIERFEAGKDEVLVEIGSDYKLEVLT
ncbi:Calpain-like protease palB/RIM13 [Wickerhamomyces ciferrii]|uniref:Cysteine protease RIM13 n=1 Tax=Wickerhamomyces ciferrii (strain ATCC 14091 / BCRC 22168 / CBS 111 / JCM 3599 / NBRC 0793 / NRRL Y-1031 F-60-10) TaxID=1206466 RepID=K0KJJ1_WICCF|nr:Calpain-like protease palB/RIM13 [Wickerhamomyces ciferrii]CCH42282.1 Calpain-like protease palB/RIM13 [Wickerhamomyces ciferrii]